VAILALALALAGTDPEAEEEVLREAEAEPTESSNHSVKPGRWARLTRKV